MDPTPSMEPTADPNFARRPEALLDAGETPVNVDGPIAVDDFSV